MLRALAGIVHDRQSPDHEHRQGEDDQNGGFHCDLATAGPNPNFRGSKRTHGERTARGQASNRRADHGAEKKSQVSIVNGA